MSHCRCIIDMLRRSALYSIRVWLPLGPAHWSYSASTQHTRERKPKMFPTPLSILPSQLCQNLYRAMWSQKSNSKTILHESHLLFGVRWHIEHALGASEYKRRKLMVLLNFQTQLRITTRVYVSLFVRAQKHQNDTLPYSPKWCLFSFMSPQSGVR